MRASPLILAALLTACGSTGQEEVRHPLFAHGTMPAPFMAGAWEVTLDVARVDIGPVYFCATEAASSDLCPAAVAEFAASGLVDALDPSSQRLGEVVGFSGTVRSATWDYGFNWFTTQRAARPTATSPGGHSAHFEGRATRDGRTVRFVSDVDVRPMIQGSRAVQGARVNGTLRAATARLDLAFDARRWWSGVDFDEVAAIEGDPAVVPATSRAHNAVVIAMTTTGAPSFTWSE